MFYRYFNFLFDNMNKYIRFHRAAAELYALSDRELEDIGLTRGEIYSTVYGAMVKE